LIEIYFEDHIEVNEKTYLFLKSGYSETADTEEAPLMGNSNENWMNSSRLLCNLKRFLEMQIFQTFLRLVSENYIIISVCYF
tara:strand:+ start:146 stop:391 length:246 start_codon:yes stop_codon:yes gene_type:complete